MLSSKIMQNGVHLPDIRSTFRSFLQSESRKRARAAAGHGENEDDYDLYALLSLSTNASQNDIKKAYKRKCKEYHPDKNNGDQAMTELFKQITNAYEGWEEQEGAEEKKKRGGGGVARDGAGLKRAKIDGGVVHGDYDDVVKKENASEMRVRPSVLLVDEVDVFFGEGFYGNSYRPCIDLDDGYDDGFNLLRFVWESRDSFPRTSVRKLMARKEVAGLRTTFPNWSEAMLERELLKMLEAVERFPKSCAPKLRGGENEYKFLREEKRKKPREQGGSNMADASDAHHEDRLASIIMNDMLDAENAAQHGKRERKQKGSEMICYIDPASGVPCDSITYGYVPNISRTCGLQHPFST
jgi:hypothetical protein